MKRRIPSFDDFIFESYTLKQVCNIQASGSVKQSCDIIFNSTPDDTFELINVRVKDIKAPKGLTLSFYKRRSLDEDVAIVERLITAYSNGEKVPPIIVDYDMTIMDGLHRYVAIKEYFGNNGKVEVFQKNKNMNESLYERSFPESDVSFVKKILNKHKDDLIGKGLGNLEIEQKLNKIFMKYNMEFSVGFGTPAFDDSARVGLVEAAIDEDGRIHIHYKEYFYEIFEDDELWNEFITVLSRIVAHERTHLHQLKQIRNGRDITDYYEILSKVKADLSNRYKYLSNKQEIMAFAVEAVEEFRSLGYSDKDILKKIKTPFKDNVESNIFYLYTDYFDYSWDGYNKDERKKLKDVLDRFLKYMYQYVTKDSIKL